MGVTGKTHYPLKKTKVVRSKAFDLSMYRYTNDLRLDTYIFRWIKFQQLYNEAPAPSAPGGDFQYVFFCPKKTDHPLNTFGTMRIVLQLWLKDTP